MRWRKEKRTPRDPTWIFSTWPIPIWRDGIPTVVVTPEDTYRLPQASERLLAISGGVIRMTPGDYYVDEYYIDDALELEGTS